MRIEIEYESSWRNSFLSDEENDHKKKITRKFIATSKLLTNNFKEKCISHNTVMGILNRLIGEQKKLYQARKRNNYYFYDIENKISFNDISYDTQEVVYLRNIDKKSVDPKAFAGIVKASDPSFISDYSVYLWGIVFLELNELFDYILNPNIEHLKKFNKLIEPIRIKNRLSSFKGNLKSSDQLNLVKNVLSNFKKIEQNETVKISTMYHSALYWQLEQLKEAFDISSVLSRDGKLTGIALSGIFTEKDFMARYSTGGMKKAWGTPYLLKPKMVTEIPKMLTKAQGTLEINLNISRERALDLEQKILDAGVSSFYLGKKGLAYVTRIDTRENL